MPDASAPLPPVDAQLTRLIGLGVHELAGMPVAAFRALADQRRDALVVPSTVPVSTLAPLVRHAGQPGFVVADMTDVDAFAAVVPVPDGPAYLVEDIDRGDALAGWSPVEADAALSAAGRTPLTLAEGLYWLLQCPDRLQRNHCFMTIGSRRRKVDGTLDARTPAVWISNGTGRDGPGRRDAPKVGWCWANNRHTWLGFASAARRVPLPVSR